MYYPFMLITKYVNNFWALILAQIIGAFIFYYIDKKIIFNKE
jgi:hypothetical protein